MDSRAFVLIGAGSTVFTPGLLRDLVSSGAFEDFEVRLVDINPVAAETMARIGRRLAEQSGSRVRIEAVADRRTALRGAAFVATTIAAGFAEGWRRDLTIPERHGIHQTVGDSVGPGGVLRALRHIPALLAIARDIADVAPQAQLINYSNPLTANVRAIARETGIAVAGLCHGTMHTKAMLARALEVDPKELHAVFAGLNHLCWLLDLRSGGVDLYPRLLQLVQTAAGGRDAPSSRIEGLHAPVSADLMRTFGYYPAPGDRHVSEFFGDYLHPRGGGELDWGLQGGLDETREYIEEKDDLWAALNAQADGSQPVEVRANQEAERLVAIAETIMLGPERVELAVNLPNNGKITNLPASAVVEVPAVVDTSGITGLAIGELPRGIAAVLTARAAQQELIVDAAVSGRRELALQALALDPLVPDSAAATAILDDAVAADPDNLGHLRAPG